MKKILSTMLLALAAAFTFTSCEDVPAPYDTPTSGGGTGGDETELTGDGTEEKPYSVTDIKTGTVTGTEVFVKAYIVGYVPDKSLDEAVFSAEGCEAVSNVIVAASASENTVANVMAVQLPTGAVRSALNLKDNPSNLKQEVLLCGNIENYFGKAGLKSVVWAKIGTKEVGTKPGTETPAADPKGSGTLEDPYNVAAALNYTKSLATDATSDKEIYIKGKVSTISSEFKADTYGNATYYISDDGTTNNQFYAFRSLYLKNTKYTEGNTNIKVGDEVVICGKVTNYKGNTPETVANQSYLYSLNGKTEGENQGGSTGGEEKPTEGGMGVAELINGKTSNSDLPTNAYGSQSVSNESTWYTWKYNNIAYSGARICKASDDNGGNIQVQGNASDAAKQGFIFNSTAFANDIKTITITVRGASKYDTPTTFNVYGGSTAHPTTTAIKGSYTKETDGNFNVFTMTYNFEAGCKYFTIWNNAVGVLYIDKITVTLN